MCSLAHSRSLHSHLKLHAKGPVLFLLKMIEQLQIQWVLRNSVWLVFEFDCPILLRSHHNPEGEERPSLRSRRLLHVWSLNKKLSHLHRMSTRCLAQFEPRLLPLRPTLSPLHWGASWDPMQLKTLEQDPESSHHPRVQMSSSFWTSWRAWKLEFHKSKGKA